MTVRVYRHDDVGAPELSGTVGTLIALLDACLVDGYGSKIAAGWTKDFSGAGLAAYRMGAGGRRFLRVDDTVAANARFVGYESMSGIEDGYGAFPTASQISGGGRFTKSTANSTLARPWIIVADAARIILWVSASTVGGLDSAGTTPKQLFFFGDISSHKAGDEYNCMIICGTSTAESSTLTGVLGHLGAVAPGHFIARSFTQIGQSIPAGKHSDCMKLGLSNDTSGASGSAAAYPDPVTGGG